MKKLFCLGSFIAMILAAPGCDRNNMEPDDEMVTKVIYATNSQTRTSLDGTDVIWEKDDTVCCIAFYEDDRLDHVSYSVYYNIHPTEINGSSARIEVTCGSAFTPEYIIYPSSKDVKRPAEGFLEIPVPESYTMVNGNIPAASNIAVGKIDGDNVFMKNTMTLMKFEIDYPDEMDAEIDGIKQITISSNAGEAIAGSMLYDALDERTVSVSGSSKLVLNMPDDELYFPEGTYWFPLPAITLSQGLKVKLSRGDDWVAEKSYGEELVLERNRIVNLGKTSEWGLVYENTVRVLTGLCRDDAALVNKGWAFEGVYPSYKNVCGQGLVGPYYLPDNNDAPFYFFVQKDANSSHDSWRSTNGAGFRFGGTVHDYMLLPAIPGYKLTSVYILSGKSVTYAITDNPVNGSPTPVDGGESKNIGEKKNHTFVLNGTLSNTAYRLDLPTTTFAAIYEFRLTYEKD